MSRPFSLFFKNSCFRDCLVLVFLFFLRDFFAFFFIVRHFFVFVIFRNLLFTHLFFHDSSYVIFLVSVIIQTNTIAEKNRMETWTKAKTKTKSKKTGNPWEHWKNKKELVRKGAKEMR